MRNSARYARLVFATGILVMASLSGAAEVGPDAMLMRVTDEVLQIVRSDKDLKAGNSHKAAELVEAKVVPNFNFAHMTQLAVGRDWRQASVEQKKQLTEEFRKLLVRTYSKALTQYKNQTVTYKPLEMKPAQSDVKVRSEIRQPGAKPIALDYYLEKMDTGWKVYDIEVEGISLVTNYRDTFASEIKLSGLDGLIASLREKNGGGLAEAAANKS